MGREFWWEDEKFWRWMVVIVTQRCVYFLLQNGPLKMANSGNFTLWRRG